MEIAASETLGNKKSCIGILMYVWTMARPPLHFLKLYLLCILCTRKIPLRFAEPIRHANTLFPHTFILLDKHARKSSQIFGSFVIYFKTQYNFIGSKGAPC